MNNINQANKVNKAKEQIIKFSKNIFLLIKNNKWIIGYLSVLFTLLSAGLIQHYFNMGLFVFDYGLEHQVLHNTANGRLFQSSYEVTNYLGDHFSPIILIGAIFYKFLPFGFTPILLQNLGFVVGLLGLYHISNHVLKNKLVSFCLVALFSVYPPILSALYFHYHPIVFSFPFLIWGLYFYLHNYKYKYYGALLLLIAGLGKEDAGLTIAAIAFYEFVTKRNWRDLVFMSVMTIYCYLSVTTFIPYFRGAPQDSLDKYGYLGKGAADIIKNLFTNLKIFTQAFLHKTKIEYSIRMFKPFLFLPLISCKIIILVPAFAVNYLSNPGGSLLSNEFHYDILTSGLIMYLFIDALNNIKNILVNYLQIDINLEFYKKIYPRLFGLIVSIIFITFNFSLFISNKITVISYGTNTNYATFKDLKYVQSFVPENATVIFDSNAGGYFGKFPKSRCFPSFCSEVKPVTFEEVEYVVFLKSALSDTNYKRYLDDHTNELEVFVDTANVISYKKIITPDN